MIHRYNYANSSSKNALFGGGMKKVLWKIPDENY
jgi:hypothetical protein